jgi:hypothetical protein
MPDESPKAQPPINGRGAVFAAGTEGLRSTTKWILAALAGTGAALIAGLQLSPLGHLAGGRLVVAVTSALVALMVILWVVLSAARVLTDDWVSLGQLEDEAFQLLLLAGKGPAEKWSAKRRVADLRVIRSLVERDGHALFRHMAKDVPELHQLHQQANEAARVALAASPLEQAPQSSRADHIGLVSQDVMSCANYHRTRLLFGALMRRLAIGATLVTLAVITFAWAANAPDSPLGPIQIRIVK